jgi:hypothetical protein
MLQVLHKDKERKIRYIKSTYPFWDAETTFFHKGKKLFKEIMWIPLSMLLS